MSRILYPFAQAYPVTSSFEDHKNREPPSNMPGTDLGAPHGTEILASVTGTIQDFYLRTGGGLSGWIVGETEKVYIAHLSHHYVVNHQQVKMGDVVGLVGSTGKSTGPHLHISCYIINQNNVWARDDPEKHWTDPSKQPAYPPEEVSPMNIGTLLTLHAQSKGPYFDRFLQEARPHYVKVMDWGTDWPYPETRVILRLFEDDKITSERAGRGATGAKEAFERWAPEWSKRAHYAWAIEDVANEPHPMHDHNFNVALDDYTCEMSRLFAQEGWRYAGNLFSVGWPDVGKAHQFKASMTQLAKAGHLWGPHEYNNPVCQVMGSDGKPYWMGRISMTVKELRQAGAQIPAIYIGECGIDLGVSTPEAGNPPGKGVVAQEGWLYLSQDPNWYMPQLIWYDDLLAQGVINQHVSILAACIYNSGGYSPWESFEITEPLMDLLIQRWQTYRGDRPEVQKAAPAQPPPKPMPPEPVEPEPETSPAMKSLEAATHHLVMALDYHEKGMAQIMEALEQLDKAKGEIE